MKTIYSEKLPSLVQLLERNWCLALVSFGTSALMLSLWPQTASSSGSFFLNVEPIFAQESFEPPGDGQPRDTIGAGSREGRPCQMETTAVEPLVPDHSYGLTFQERPAIFVKMEPATAQQAVLTFRNEAGTYYETALLPIELSGEVAKFSLPETAPALAVGENYYWSLVLVCSNARESGPPTISGWVQRVAQSKLIQAQLSGLSLLEQVQWYGAHGYWYDLITAVGQAYLLSPNNGVVADLWHELTQ